MGAEPKARTNESTMIGRLGKLGVTRDMFVKFLKPVPTECELMIEGEITKQDNKQVELHSTIHSSDDELLAEATSNWILVSLSTITNISKVDEGKLQDFLAQYPINPHE